MALSDEGIGWTRSTSQLGWGWSDAKRGSIGSRLVSISILNSSVDMEVSLPLEAGDSDWSESGRGEGEGVEGVREGGGEGEGEREEREEREEEGEAGATMGWSVGEQPPSTSTEECNEASDR